MNKYIFVKKKKIYNTIDIKLSLNKDERQIGINNVKYIFDNIDEIYKNHYKKGRIWLTKEEIRDYYKVLLFDESLLLIHKFTRKIPNNEKYYKRLVKEFLLIKEKNFTKVFLQVKLILDLIDNNVLHIIRGSSGSSLVCYLLGITDIDPVLENISLARFMHEKREDIPDIDMDFPTHLRNDIFKKIYENWEGRVARISNNVTFGHKSALREAIRNTGYNKFLPKNFDINDIFDNEDMIKEIISNAEELEGTTKNKSLHCGGIVIFEKCVPKNLFLKSIKIEDILGTQISLDKDEVEDNKLIKIDILSNRGLSQLMFINPKKINDYDYNDNNIWKLLSDGDNLGLTHGESRTIAKVLKILKPKSIKELASCLALIRPAASGNGQKSAYLKDYNTINSDSEKYKDYIIYDDDAIEYISKILKKDESYGDRFRRAFAKKNNLEKFVFKQMLKKVNPTFNNDKIELIIENLTCLENYSFCKSHAYSYAKLLYALAYNKYYYPQKFWLATLNNCNSSYRTWVHMRQCVHNNLELSYGKRPWKLSGNKLVSDKSHTKFIVNDIDDYFKHGYWISKNFLENMYFNTEKKIIKKNNENILTTVCKFRGLIAIHRTFFQKLKKNSKITENIGKYISGQEEYTQKNKIVTFVTIGYDNNLFYDLIIWGKYNFSKIYCIEGTGVINELNSYPWVSVNKFKVSYL